LDYIDDVEGMAIDEDANGGYWYSGQESGAGYRREEHVRVRNRAEDSTLWNGGVARGEYERV